MPHGTLEVILANGKGLRDKDIFGKMDPFVELIIDSQKQKSKVHIDGGRNPNFNQTFTFNILAGCNTLQVEVWDQDSLSSNDHIGGTKINLDLVVFPNLIQDEWFQLVTRSGKPAGQLHLCLNFKPRTAIKPPGPSSAPVHNTLVQQNTAPQAMPQQQLYPLNHMYAQQPPAHFYQPQQLHYQPQPQPLNYQSPQPPIQMNYQPQPAHYQQQPAQINYAAPAFPPTHNYAPPQPPTYYPPQTMIPSGAVYPYDPSKLAYNQQGQFPQHNPYPPQFSGAPPPTAQYPPQHGFHSMYPGR